MKLFPIPSQSDGEGLLLHFTGGLSAALADNELWRVMPLVQQDKACVTEPVSMDRLREIALAAGSVALGYHSFGWINGVRMTSWRPIVAGRSNHAISPANRWSNISRNLGTPRMEKVFQSVPKPTIDQVSRVLDDHAKDEALASFISLSLQNCDFCVLQICQYYQEQLINQISSGLKEGQRGSNTLIHELFSLVHSFFLHLGSARDYLGALIAYRLGLDEKKDDMSRLVAHLHQADSLDDPLVKALQDKGYITRKSNQSGRYKFSGWLEEVSTTRSTLVHKRPFGSVFSEQMASYRVSEKLEGVLAHYHPISINGSREEDTLDFIAKHYRMLLDLLSRAADVLPYDESLKTLTEADIVSVRFNSGFD